MTSFVVMIHLLLADYHTVVTEDAGGANVTGLDNTFVGVRAGDVNTASNNTFFGTDAGGGNTTGTGNTYIGKSAGDSNSSGDNNTAIVINSDINGGLDNSTAIGNGASCIASNKVRIGNAVVTVIEGQVAYTFPSDARFKFNINDENIPGLSFINKLRPVTYQFDTRKFDEHLMQYMPDSFKQKRLEGNDYTKSNNQLMTGFLAQEVEQACKDLDYTFRGLHVPESDVDNYGLAYGSFVPLIVKGMQEQQEQIETLLKANQELTARLVALEQANKHQ